MVGRLQGTCGEIGGKATTVIDFRAPLGQARSHGRSQIILCFYVHQGYESLGFLAKYLHSVPETD
jgi:hypothetical protein